jgi:hypothetical protein
MVDKRCLIEKKIVFGWIFICSLNISFISTEKQYFTSQA